MNSEEDLACKTICRPHNSIQSAGAAVGSEAILWLLMWIHCLLLLLLFEAFFFVFWSGFVIHL